MVFSLDLRDFLLRARVLKLYRQALRTTRRAPVQARGDNYSSHNPCEICFHIITLGEGKLAPSPKTFFFFFVWL